jgi:asparagine synthase (glutamine-hydrolysing)
MVNFAAIVDADTQRRESYIKRVEPIIAPVEGLVVQSSAYQDFSIIWAAGSWTPVSRETSSSGFSIIFGDAIDKDSSRKIDAKENQLRWSNVQRALPAAYEGYHAALTYDQNGKLTCGVDILGLFPLYYYSYDDAILVGSSPELFRYCSDFSMQLDLKGLVGILLINGSFKGRTLLKGINRLEAGHLLHWEHGKQPKETKQYSVPLSTEHFDFSIQEAMGLLDLAIDQAVKRHTRSGTVFCLLLSGGLDSRMIAGYLKRNNVNFIAVTEGLETDQEMKCAIRVARELEVKHIEFNLDLSLNAELDAQKTADLEHLACGFSSVRHFGYRSLLRRIAPRVISGYLCDAIVGGSEISSAYSKSKGVFLFENFLSDMNAWGIKTVALRRMLREEIFDDLVTDLQKEIKEVYDSYSQVEFQKALLFDLHHQQRYYIGGLLWKLSFGAWPVAPIDDSQVLEVVGGLPFPILMYRRLETELVHDRFPGLARLPLDRATYFTAPVKPSLIQKAKLELGHIFTDESPLKDYNPISILSRKLLGQRVNYRRTTSFDNPTWKTLRKAADLNRKTLYQFFNCDVLDQVLPRAEVNSHLIHQHSSGPKILVGFSLWLNDHELGSP